MASSSSFLQTLFWVNMLVPSLLALLLLLLLRPSIRREGMQERGENRGDVLDSVETFADTTGVRQLEMCVFAFALLVRHLRSANFPPPSPPKSTTTKALRFGLKKLIFCLQEMQCRHAPSRSHMQWSTRYVAFIQIRMEHRKDMQRGDAQFLGCCHALRDTNYKFWCNRESAVSGYGPFVNLGWCDYRS